MFEKLELTFAVPMERRFFAKRDDALRIARGGSISRRISRAAKWFAIGAAAGAVAPKAAR
jgi:hypothetical protein